MAQPFSREQKYHIEAGIEQADELEQRVLMALGLLDLEVQAKRHHYIVGPPGIGKSYQVRAQAKKYGVNKVEIVGATSMSGFVVKLATSLYQLRDQKEDLVVWIDDCDFVFFEREYISAMKGALDEDRNLLSWNKNLVSFIQSAENSSLNKEKQTEALGYYQIKGGFGVEIPTDNIRFVITSNHALHPSYPKPKKGKRTDEAAVRDRVAYKEFDLDIDTYWGWLATVTLNAKLFGSSNDPSKQFKLNKEQKMILLHWLYTNREVLPMFSMRFVNELAADMRNYSDCYIDKWNMHLVRK